MTRAECNACSFRNSCGTGPAVSGRGFSLVEFLLATLVLFVVAGAIFGLLAQTQRTASYQTEVQAVLENTRIAMETVQRIIRQAGNDPHHVGFDGITITSSTEVEVRSDLTGSGGVGNGDRGDPDGDTSDSGEDVTIRYNATAHTIELVPQGGTATAIATNIYAFDMQYLDPTGTATLVGSAVRRVTISLTGASALPDPQTGQVFSLQLTGDVQIANRQ